MPKLLEGSHRLKASQKWETSKSLSWSSSSLRFETPKAPTHRSKSLKGLQYREAMYEGFGNLRLTSFFAFSPYLDIRKCRTGGFSIAGGERSPRGGKGKGEGVSSLSLSVSLSKRVADGFFLSSSCSLFFPHLPSPLKCGHFVEILRAAVKEELLAFGAFHQFASRLQYSDYLSWLSATGTLSILSGALLLRMS